MSVDLRMAKYQVERRREVLSRSYPRHDTRHAGDLERPIRPASRGLMALRYWLAR